MNGASFAVFFGVEPVSFWRSLAFTRGVSQVYGVYWSSPVERVKYMAFIGLGCLVQTAHDQTGEGKLCLNG